MRKLFLQSIAVVVWLVSMGRIEAQVANVVSGQVTNSSKKPVAAASVSLLDRKDSSVQKTVVAAEDGKFIFNQAKPGNWLLLVSAVGYEKYYASVAINATATVIPVIQLKENRSELTAVTVSANKSFTEQKIDRTIVNVDALISNTGSTALEVLEKTPGVLVDENGNITFKGKNNVLVLIDDKPTYLSATDLATYLRSLPASALDKIELMENPPAKYDASGNAGVINIRTKKSKLKGFNGSLASSYGQSFYWRTNESANLNYYSGKINLFANLSYYFQNSGRKLEISRTYLDASGHTSSVFKQENYFNTVSKSPSAKIGFDYYSSSKTTWGIVYTGSISDRQEARPTYSSLYNSSGAMDSSIVADNHSASNFKKTGLNLNYTHKFDSTGKVLSFDLDYLKYASNADQSFLNSVFISNNLKSTQSLAAALPSNISIYAAKTDYAQALPGKVKFEAGLKSSYVSSDNEANYFNINGGTRTVDYNNTNHFIYKENINAAYINLNKEFGRISLQTGLRVENTNGSGHQLGNLYKPDSAFTNHYTNLFPTAYLSYKLDSAGNNLLNLSYGRRIDRPNYQDLNPFIFLLDKFTYFAGNPFLRPQFSSNYKLAYTYKNRFTVALVYDYVKDVQIETIEQNGSSFISRTGNIGIQNFAGLSFDMNVHPAKWWTSSVFIELDYLNYHGALYSGSINSKSLYGYATSNNQFNLGDGWSAEISGFYLSHRISAQFDKIPFGQLNAGLQKKILKNKGAVKFSARDIFNTNTSAGMITNIPNVIATYRNYFYNQTFTIGLTYSFGNVSTVQEKRKTGSAESEANRAGN